MGDRKKCAQKQHDEDKLANQERLDILLKKNPNKPRVIHKVINIIVDKNNFLFPYLTARCRNLNDVIKPYNTLYRLINGAEMLALKVDSNPKMKYINIVL